MDSTRFLHGNGKPANTPALLNVESMAREMTYIWFSCTLGASSIDNKITRDVVCAQFYIKTPQSMYDVSTKIVTNINIPSKPMNYVPSTSASQGNMYANITSAYSSHKRGRLHPVRPLTLVL